jgi:hypothetical protein
MTNLVVKEFKKSNNDLNFELYKDVLLNNPKACSDAFKIVKNVLPDGIKSHKEDSYYNFSPSFGMSLATFLYKDVGKKVDLLFNTGYSTKVLMKEFLFKIIFLLTSN